MCEQEQKNKIRSHIAKALKVELIGNSFLFLDLVYKNCHKLVQNTSTINLVFSNVIKVIFFTPQELFFFLIKSMLKF